MSTGPVLTGAAKNFSGWYSICLETPEPGYKIDLSSVRFDVSGDRTCSSWGQCEQTQVSDERGVGDSASKDMMNGRPQARVAAWVF